MRVAVVATAICLSIVGLADAQDAKASTRMTTNIPAQGLGPALKTFAQERDLQVLYFSQTVSDLRTSGATGTLTADEALTQLLSGTGLVFRYVGDKAVTILPADKEGGALPTKSDDASTASAEKEGKNNSSAGFRTASLAQGPASQSAPVAGPTPALQDGSGKVALEEVIVTAQKSPQRAIDVPISLVVLSPQELQRRQIYSTEDLQFAVPGLTVQGGGAQRRINLRGVSNSFGNGAVVGEYFDEADITSASSSATFGYGEFDARPYDLERVEVLRGPQGTLFGVGAMGGVIRFITNRPVLDRVQMSADMSSSFTQYGAPGQRIEAMINTPIIADKLALRIAGETEHGGGWIDEPTASLKNINGNDLTDVRIQARWQPSSRLNVYATQTIHRNSYGLGTGEDASGNVTQPFNLIVQRIFRSFLAVAPIRFSSHRETAVRSARPKAGQKLRVFMLLPLASPGSAAGP